MTAVWLSARARSDEYWSWQLSGSCLDHPADLFFPDSERRALRQEREEQAKRVCRDCPVLMRCREHAISVPERYGIWGATTPRERGILPAHRRAQSTSR